MVVQEHQNLLSATLHTLQAHSTVDPSKQWIIPESWAGANSYTRALDDLLSGMLQ